jgi:hypothetical protein
VKVHLYDFESGWSLEWVGNCPTCSKQYDSSYFKCPACDGNIISVMEKQYRGLAAKFLLRCEHGHIRLLSIPCPVDGTPIQGHNLLAEVTLVKVGFKRLFVLGVLSGLTALLYFGYGFQVLKIVFFLGLYLMVAIFPLIFLAYISNFLKVNLLYPIDLVVRGVYWTLPKSKNWYHFCQPSDREAFRNPN